MEKVVKITSLHSQESDREYWAKKSPRERIEALEMLRQQQMEQPIDAQRVQRVYRIIKRK